MIRNFKTHIGMRTIKTGLAVAICLALGQLLGYPAPIYACIAAVTTMRESIDASLRDSVSRILATIFGGAMGMVVLGLNVNALNPWLEIPAIGIAVIVTIHMTIVVKRPDTTALAVVVLLIIVLDHADDKYIYAIRRIIETIIGIMTAVAMNAMIRRKPT